MALKTYKPITPGLRQLVKVDRSGLHKGGPVKALARGLAKSGGRNNLGRTTNWLMGGGHKRSLSDRRFQASQIRHAGEGRTSRI